MRVMIAQDIDRTRDYLKERGIGSYGRLKKIPCAVKGQASARAIDEKSGLAACRALGVEAKIRLREDSFWAICRPIAPLLAKNWPHDPI